MSLNDFNWILITSASQHHAKWLLVAGQVQRNSIPNIGSASKLPIRPRISAKPNNSSLVSTRHPGQAHVHVNAKRGCTTMYHSSPRDPWAFTRLFFLEPRSKLCTVLPTRAFTTSKDACGERM
jgi:hypothetical protein